MDWRTGEVGAGRARQPRPADGVRGRTIAPSDAAAQVVDVASGDVLFESRGWLRLSPTAVTPSRARARAVFRGGPRRRDVRRRGTGSVTYGWTTDDQLVGIVDGQLAVCSPESGRCTTSPLPGGVSSDAFVRLPGFTYES